MTSLNDKPGLYAGRKTSVQSLPGTRGGSQPLRRVPFAQFLRFSWPGRLFLLAGSLLAIICLFFAEENWRGRRAWEICQRELAAKAVELDWQKFVPPPVAGDQNFAATPFLAPLFDFNSKPRGPGQTIWRDMPAHDRAASFAAALLPIDNQGQIPPARFDGKTTDLEGALLLLQGQTSHSSARITSFTTRTEAAAALLAALEDYKPVLDELRLASRRPYSRFDIEYKAPDPISILLPHHLVLLRVCRVLELRSSAELSLQRIEAAFEDVQLMQFLAGSIRDEPFLISLMARGSMLKRTEQIIWEGLAGRNWTDPQLEQLERALESSHLLIDLEKSLEAERAAFGGTLFRYMRAHKNVLRNWIASMDDARSFMYLLVGPSGWFYQEQVSYHRLYDQHVLAGLDASSGRVHPRMIEESRKALENELQYSAFWHHTGFSKIVLSQATKTLQRVAFGQNRANQTMIACALERYRLTHGKYPGTLEALSPGFIVRLPLDVCTGGRLKYRLLQDGPFVLYGVGWNETDEGGVLAMKQDGVEIDSNRGDWVWPQYPER